MDDDPDIGLRERKRRETRAALSLAAIRLSIQQGWDNVTVDDIAASANVSPRTFRNYFSTKAEAVAAGHLERMLRVADELRARPTGEPLWTAIANSVVSQFESPGKPGMAAGPEAARWLERTRFLFTEPAIHAEVLRASAVAQVELAKAIAGRLGPKHANGLYPELVAAVANSVTNAVVDRWFRNGPSGPVAPLLRKAFDWVAAGLPEKKPRRQLER